MKLNNFSNDFKLDGFGLSILTSPKYDWGYSGKSARGCRAYKNNCDLYSGKMLGGCHGHNAMAYIRGNDRDYNNWEWLGNPTWNWETALKYFKKSEANQNAEFVAYKNGKYHSTNGKLIVDSFSEPDPLTEDIIAAALESGQTRLYDINAGKYLGIGFMQGTIHNGWRHSTANDFLVPASERPNLHVIKHAHVTQIEFVRKKAVGVHFMYKDKHQMFARCAKGVILTAGTLASPQILMLSGIGPKKHLKKHGIPVIQDLPVGKNLHDHTVVPIYFQVRSNDAVVSDELEKQKSLERVFQFAVYKRGELTKTSAHLYSAWSTSNDTVYPDIQNVYAMTKPGKFGATLHDIDDTTRSILTMRNKNYEILTIYLYLLKVKSRGTVKLRSCSYKDKPKINMNLLSHKEDVEALVRAVKLQTAHTNTNTFRRRGVKFICMPIPNCDHPCGSDEYNRCYVFHYATTGYHVCGTSKMGPNTDAKAVVDPQLRIRGIENVWQMDAGIMPVVPSGNTNTGTVMIAERGADFIKKVYGET